MTKEETAKVIEVMNAFVDGKEIEFDSLNCWESTTEPMWNWCDDINTYRVKTQPKYKPYDDALEVQRDKWVKLKSSHVICRINKIDTYTNVALGVNIDDNWYSLNDFFDRFVYEDGSPCGKEVSE